jgi:very-short-patch-repair endonuclease
MRGDEGVVQPPPVPAVVATLDRLSDFAKGWPLNEKGKPYQVGGGSAGEQAFEYQLKWDGISFEREAKVIPNRNHRVDFLLAGNVVVEIEGSIWVMGRHSSGRGWLNDAWKYNTLAALGFRVFRFATEQVVGKKGVPNYEAIEWMKANVLKSSEGTGAKNLQKQREG